MMPTAQTAAVAAVAWVALYAGHQLGDHPLQLDADARRKVAPDPGAGADPWTGWGHCVRHVAIYTTVQAVCLALASLVAPVTLAGGLAALAVSAATHAVIDRRWLVQAIIRAKGGCADWPGAAYAIDQSLHVAALWLAALAAALAPSLTLAAGVTTGCLAVVAGYALLERHRLGLTICNSLQCNGLHSTVRAWRWSTRSWSRSKSAPAPGTSWRGASTSRSATSGPPATSRSTAP
ncbi:MAG: hypothetical protein ACRDT6_05295 [Micromonosporaceae bacterium]